jgi:hypothetical protein
MGMLLAIFPGVIRGALKFPQLTRRRLASIKAVRTQIDHLSVVIQEILSVVTDELSSAFERIKKRLADGANVSLKISHRSKPIR